MIWRLTLPWALAALGCFQAGTRAADPLADFDAGRFTWRASGPLIDVGPGRTAPDPHVSIKDPTFVFHENAWHLFATLRRKSGQVDIEYLSFPDWPRANAAPRHLLALHDQYYCAPQVFYFTPHQKWYLVYQLADKNRTPAFGPCCSTSPRLGDPQAWSRPQPMVTNAPPQPKWLDFWVICDERKAHLFYTSLDGNLWRRETAKSAFPLGWSEPQLALHADLFEASHTYRLQGRRQYLTLVEAQGGNRRYYKAWLADRLEGPWKGLADTLDHAFAASASVRQEPAWATSISHGELVRTGCDEYLEVDPARLRFIFQGCNDAEYRGQGYGGIPWRLGLLEPETKP
jgi:hypothetical protein